MRHMDNLVKSKRKDLLGTVALVVLLLLGFAVLLYPVVSNEWNSRAQSRAVAVYDAAVANMKEEEYSAYFDGADSYNEKLRSIGSIMTITTPSLIADYDETLDITGTGIMGYVSIERINIQLPIYHGTSASVLQIAAGHLEGTSLPTGGEGTHCVISAHRGLPSAKLFTDLDEMEVGDTFNVTVLDRVMTYEVDQINIILPDEIEKLCIEEGEDYVTLMTCTPYGINTHRLLVRGKRAENTGSIHSNVTVEATKVNLFLVAMILASPILLISLIWLLGDSGRHRQNKFHTLRH